MNPRVAGTITVVAALALGVFAATSGGGGAPQRPKTAATPPATSVSVAVQEPSDIEPPAPTVAPVETGSALSALLGPGGEVPPLPDKSPKAVHFGVVLFSYEGAQGASPNAPSKKAALEHATQVLATATTDFAAAAKQGDPGSVANAGRMARGVLEPVLEYALFTLDKGQVFPEPLDTPRGYWLLKRVD